jgi:hypothetical protein
MRSLIITPSGCIFSACILSRCTVGKDAYHYPRRLACLLVVDQVQRLPCAMLKSKSFGAVGALRRCGAAEMLKPEPCGLQHTRAVCWWHRAFVDLRTVTGSCQNGKTCCQNGCATIARGGCWPHLACSSKTSSLYPDRLLAWGVVYLYPVSYQRPRQ